MPVIQKCVRNTLQFICWEQEIGADNPVRVIDAFVDFLDLEDLGFQLKGQSHQGRPAYRSNILYVNYE